MKIAAQIPPEPSQDDLTFINQMGIEYVVFWTGGDKASYDDIKKATMRLWLSSMVKNSHTPIRNQSWSKTNVFDQDYILRVTAKPAS